LYSLLHYISIHNREYPLILLKKNFKNVKKKNFGNPQFVVSLSNVIGLCRRHWLGQPISNHLQLSAKVSSMVRFR